MIKIKTVYERLCAVLRLDCRFVWRFVTIGAVSMGAQLALQRWEVHHGWHIFWWTFLQGGLLANAGLVANRLWTFKHRGVSWAWAFLIWNVQKVPHTAASMALFGSLLAVPGLPYWCATLLTTAIVGVGSLVATNWWTGDATRFDRWSAILVVSFVIGTGRYGTWPLKAETT